MVEASSWSSWARRKKSAAERRAQQKRADARSLQRLLSGLLGVQEHRGGGLQKVGRWVLAAAQAAAPTQPTRKWPTCKGSSSPSAQGSPTNPTRATQASSGELPSRDIATSLHAQGGVATKVGKIEKKTGKRSSTEMAVDVQSAEGPNEMLVDDVPKQSDTADPSAQASTTQSALAKKKKRAGKKQQPSGESAAPVPPTAAPQTRRREICEWIVAELSKDTVSMETQTMAAGPAVAERRLERKVLHLEQKLECVVDAAREAVAAKTTPALWQGMMRMINDIEMPADD